jgi:hypothetical protein
MDMGCYHCQEIASDRQSSIDLPLCKLPDVASLLTADSPSFAGPSVHRDLAT